jgi:hypothetical protein
MRPYEIDQRPFTRHKFPNSDNPLFELHSKTFAAMDKVSELLVILTETYDDLAKHADAICAGWDHEILLRNAENRDAELVEHIKNLEATSTEVRKKNAALTTKNNQLNDVILNRLTGAING